MGSDPEEPPIAPIPIRYQHVLKLGFERGKLLRMRELPTLALNRRKHAERRGLLRHQPFSLGSHSHPVSIPELKGREQE